MPEWSAILGSLRDAGVPVLEGARPRPVAGGDISAAWQLDTERGGLFLKTGPSSSFEMFAAEAEGLAELGAAEAIRVPGVRAVGEAGGTAFVALELLHFGRTDRDTERLLGERLAVLHRCTRERYGWHRDNTIGLTPQPNGWHDDWIAFFRERRIGFQLRLAADKGFGGDLQRLGRVLMDRLPDFFGDYEPEASLLHGDLWGGNWASCDGEPVIFDPAVYYGDRESDLAMTRLFGGFSQTFYRAYEAAWPLAAGHEARCGIYQLYHVINHVNLFGGAYLVRAVDTLRRLLT